ncbi:hypothetical protein CO614_09845 [Lysobacteraceae bacterium NML120232]|nr:hypothetical protein CO614_09845 [Xanthomonadaceae bacterium NML120232]
MQPFDAFFSFGAVQQAAVTVEALDKRENPMKRKTMMILGLGAAFGLLAGHALAQQQTPPPQQKEDSKQGTSPKTEEQKRAEAEAAEKRRAERRANRTGNEREKEEDEPRPQ